MPKSIPNRIRGFAKALSRHIPSINALIIQRDMLLERTADLESKIHALTRERVAPSIKVPSTTPATESSTLRTTSTTMGAMANLSREDRLLGTLDRSARIIEIGPSYNPVAPKASGWNTTTVDHAPRAALMKKYAGHPGVDINRIEDVDCIWTTGPLEEAVPDHVHGTFDALIASHVIEHMTDVVGFLDAGATILSPRGVIILAVPDKRYCFDYFRPLTTTGEVLEASASRRSRHSRRTVFEHTAYVVRNEDHIAWGQHPVGRLEFFHSLDDAGEIFNNLNDDPSAPYVDSHAWQFTPASFQLILLELARLGKTDWQIAYISPATGCEFYVRLCRGGRAATAAMAESALSARRLALLKEVLLEIHEQIHYLTLDADKS